MKAESSQWLVEEEISCLSHQPSHSQYPSSDVVKLCLSCMGMKSSTAYLSEGAAVWTQGPCQVEIEFKEEFKVFFFFY